MGVSTAIVLAEESPADVYLFREALKAHDVRHELLVFEDGEAMLNFLQAAGCDRPRPQLFVLDLNLPKIDGLTLLTQVRAMERFAHARVIILTSSDNPADRDAATEHGADCYIRKAATIAEFLDIGRVIKAMLAEP